MASGTNRSAACVLFLELCSLLLVFILAGSSWTIGVHASSSSLSSHAQVSRNFADPLPADSEQHRKQALEAEPLPNLQVSRRLADHTTSHTAGSRSLSQDETTIEAPDKAELASLESLLQGLHSHRMQNRVWMSRPEQALIESYLQPGMTMLEYGSGFSTMWYSRFVKQYYSVEHNLEWGRKVQEMVRNNSKIHYRIVPERPHTPAFSKYIEMPSQFNVTRFDAVLVDGRNRVDCARFVLDFIDRRSVVFLHDYYKRPKYFGVERWYNVISAVRENQTLVVLRKKKDLGNVKQPSGQ